MPGDADTDDRRRVARYRINGFAYWSSRRVEGRCVLRDISVYGASIDNAQPRLDLGAQLVVSLVLEGESIPTVAVEVLHLGAGLGLKFIDPPESVIRKIETITADLTPTWSLWPPEPNLSEGLADWRGSARVETKASARWAAGGHEGTCQLQNLSCEGAQLGDPVPPLASGDELTFTAVLEKQKLGPLTARVVRANPDSIAVKFHDLSERQRTEVEDLVYLFVR